MRLTTRPIDHWPGGMMTPSHRRVPSPFTASWGTTVEILDRELRHLAARNPVLMVDVPASDFRIDGDLRTNARRQSPAIIVAFGSKHGPLKYACDRFTKWEDNVRAVALGLEALRKVERYGIGSRGEQYTGWKALPPGLAMGAKMDRDEAWRVLCDLGTGDEGYRRLDNPRREDIDDLYRMAAKLHHPDAGGDADLMARANEARNVLLEEG